MKKIIYLSFFILTIFLLSLNCYAESNSPIVEPFLATVSNEDGAEIFSFTYNGTNDSQLTTNGKLDFETEIQVKSELKKNGVLYCQYIIPDDDTNLMPNYVKAEDITIVVESAISSITPNYLEPYNFKIINEKGVEIHKGPAFTYEVIGKTIPYNTSITAYRVSTDENNPWYFITYQGVEGFICELNGALGHLTKDIKSIIAPVQINVYSKTTDQENRIKEITTIGANTIIDSFLEIDPWSKMYYIPEGNYKGYINISDVAVIRQQVYDRLIEVPEDGLVLYKNADTESEVLEELIPEKTVLTGKYEQTDLSEGGWVNTTYNNVTGWVFLSKELLEDSDTKSDEQYGEFKKNKEENIIDTSNEIIDDTTIPLDESQKINLSNGPKIPTMTIICIIGGLILAIGSIILFIISKKK